MRVRRTYIVLSFRTTMEAMKWEKQCMAQQVPGRLIPLPREISADAAGRVRTLAASAGQNWIRQGRSGRTIKAGE